MVCFTWRVARGSCLAKEVAILAENMTSASVLLLAGKQDGHQRTNTKDPYAVATKIENGRSQGVESTVHGIISFYFSNNNLCFIMVI